VPGMPSPVLALLRQAQLMGPRWPKSPLTFPRPCVPVTLGAACPCPPVPSLPRPWSMYLRAPQWLRSRLRTPWLRRWPRSPSKLVWLYRRSVGLQRPGLQPSRSGHCHPRSSVCLWSPRLWTLQRIVKSPLMLTSALTPTPGVGRGRAKRVGSTRRTSMGARRRRRSGKRAATSTAGGRLPRQGPPQRSGVKSRSGTARMSPVVVLVRMPFPPPSQCCLRPLPCLRQRRPGMAPPPPGLVTRRLVARIVVSQTAGYPTQWDTHPV
jgi:hypothetical protein